MKAVLFVIIEGVIIVLLISEPIVMAISLFFVAAFIALALRRRVHGE